MKTNLKIITFTLLAATLLAQQINAMNAKQQLFRAIQQGNIPGMLLPFKNGDDVQQNNQYTFTLLHFAAHCNELVATKLLLENGANINLLDDLNHTPIQTAQRYGHDDIEDYFTLCDNFFTYGTMVDATRVINPAALPDYFALMVVKDDATGLREMFLQHANNKTDGYSLNLKRYIKQAKLAGKKKSLHELLALQKLTNDKKPNLPLILYAPHKPTTWTHETATLQNNLHNNSNFSDVAFVKEFKN